MDDFTKGMTRLTRDWMFVSADCPGFLTANHICGIVCEVMEVQLADLTGPRRLRGLVDARTIAAVIIRDVKGWSTTRIASQLGRTDHVTVLNWFKRAENLRSRDESFLAAEKKCRETVDWFREKIERSAA